MASLIMRRLEINIRDVRDTSAPDLSEFQWFRENDGTIFKIGGNLSIARVYDVRARISRARKTMAAKITARYRGRR